MIDANDMTPDQQMALLTGEIPYRLEQANHIDITSVREAIESGIRIAIELRTSPDFVNTLVACAVGTDPLTGETESAGIMYEIVAVEGDTRRGVYFEAADAEALTSRVTQALGAGVTIVDCQGQAPVSLSTGLQISATIESNMTRQ